jgi:7-cyano-7-deazaguanine reductase
MENKPYPVPYDIGAPDAVSADLLDPIPYAYKGRRSLDIVIEQPEFTSVCPMTGLPDFGTIVVRYQPDATIVELKSLKYYLLQYRNVGIFYEHLVNRILDDLVAALSPRRMTVEGVFTARGGITSRAAAHYEAESDAP